MRNVIAIANAKGGVGKTTTSVNLCAALSAKGCRVLLIDNDPQGHSTKSLGLPAKSLRHTLANLMYAVRDDTNVEDYLSRCIVQAGRFYIIPANNRLEGAAARFTAEKSIAIQEDVPVEYIVRRIVELCESQFDYIIIDCRPSLDILTVNALAAADRVIIPVQAHYLSEEGLDDILNAIKAVQENLNPALAIGGILLTMYQSNTNLCRSVAEDIRERYGTEMSIFEPIKHSIKVAEHPAFGTNIFEHDPGNPAALGYARLAEAVMAYGS